MMTIRNGCVLVAFAFIANMQSAGIADDEATGPSIVVVVSGLESDRGQVIVNLYNSKNDFTGGADGVVATRRVKIENAKAQSECEDVADGE